MARTKQQNDMAARDRRARKILQQVARLYGIEFSTLLEEVEEVGGLISWMNQQEG